MFSVADNLNADSNYVFLLRLLPRLIAQHPDWYFLYFFPDDIRFTYSPDGFFDSPNIIRINYPFTTNKKRNIINFPADYLNDLFKKWPIDVLFNNCVELTPQLRALFQNYSAEAVPKIINQHHYVFHHTLSYPTTKLADKGLALAQLSGAVCADVNIFNSLYCQKMLNDNFYYHWGKLPGYRSAIIPFGIETIKTAPPQDPPVIVYNHRLADYKNWRTTFAVYDDLARFRNFEVWVTGVNNQFLTEINHRRYTRLKKTKTHIEYMQAIAPGSLNSTNSEHETFCISALESQALGHLLVAPKGLSFVELVPPDYPYLFTNEHEQKNILDWLLTHPEEMKEWRKKLPDHTQKNFDLESFTQAWGKIINGFSAERIININSLKKRARFESFIAVLKEEKNPIPFDLVRTKFERAMGGTQSFPPTKIKRLLNLSGLHDLVKQRRLYLQMKLT